VPEIRERLNLSGRLFPCDFLKKNVVVCFTVKRRIEIFQIYAFVREVLLENLQVVAIEKGICIKARRSAQVVFSSKMVVPFEV
jgi:Fe-S-cluster containining protein